MSQQNQNRNQVRKSITDTSVAIEPVAVVYNIENEAIENFVYNYLNTVHKIDGVAAVRLSVVRDGNRNPQVKAYAFFDQRSEDVFSNNSNQRVSEAIRRKMDMGGWKASEKMRKALVPICKDLKLQYDSGQKLVFIVLDIFKILALMLSSDRRNYQLTVTEVMKFKRGRSIMTVIKQDRHVDRNDDSFDRFASIIDRYED